VQNLIGGLPGTVRRGCPLWEALRTKIAHSEDFGFGPKADIRAAATKQGVRADLTTKYGVTSIGRTALPARR
jgi:hypothetical protein